jgi:hypothetical protein
MALVAAAEVAAITGIDATSPVMDPAIAAADLIITEEFVSSGLSDVRKTQIELYLAAHFAVVSDGDGPLAQNKIGDAQEGYHNIYSAGLKSTQFGQQALIFDTTGILAEMSSNVESPAKKSALFTVIGTPEDEEV